MAKREIVPLGNRILIKRDKPAAKTAGGVDIPDSVQNPDNEGVVLAVGPGLMLQDGRIIPCTAKVGDRVLLASGSRYMFDREELLLVMEHEIPAIIKGGPQAPITDQEAKDGQERERKEKQEREAQEAAQMAAQAEQRARQLAALQAAQQKSKKD